MSGSQRLAALCKPSKELNARSCVGSIAAIFSYACVALSLSLVFCVQMSHQNRK